MRKIVNKVLLSILILTGIYFLGPHPSLPVYNKKLADFPSDPKALEQQISWEEQQHKLKPENEARIVWFNDSLKTPTAYVIVYLHGFTASQMEGDPVHRNLAKKMGANLYLSRLAEHGLDTVDAMINLTADAYWESAKKALSIGKKLGKKIILMGTSTGGTNAIQLAAAFPEDVYALLLLSPNIAINDPNAPLLNNQWGLHIARFVKGSKYLITPDQRDIFKKYWYSKYRLESVVALQEMLETSMTRENFQKIKQPVALLYYYKDEQHQDPVVKVSAMKEMMQQLSTPAEQKFEMALPNTGDHVIGSPIKSHDVAGVGLALDSFCRKILKMDLK